MVVSSRISEAVYKQLLYLYSPQSSSVLAVRPDESWTHAHKLKSKARCQISKNHRPTTAHIPHTILFFFKLLFYHAISKLHI